MGEITRLRDWVHEAVDLARRDAALDNLIQYVRSRAIADAQAHVSGFANRIDDIGRTEQLLLMWISDSLNELTEDR